MPSLSLSAVRVRELHGDLQQLTDKPERLAAHHDFEVYNDG